jgi:hypothetical protein
MLVSGIASTAGVVVLQTALTRNPILFDRPSDRGVWNLPMTSMNETATSSRLHVGPSQKFDRRPDSCTGSKNRVSDARLWIRKKGDCQTSARWSQPCGEVQASLSVPEALAGSPIRFMFRCSLADARWPAPNRIEAASKG